MWEQYGELGAGDTRAGGTGGYLVAGLWMWECATEDDGTYLWVGVCVCTSTERVSLDEDIP